MVLGSSVAELAQAVLVAVGQGHVARAGAYICAQHRQRVVDLVAALDADQRGDRCACGSRMSAAV